MRTLDKIVKIGTNKTPGGRFYSVYSHIEIIDGELHITGVEGPLPSGNAIGSCGQLTLNIENLNSDWTSEMLITFRYVWTKYHLNHIKSECEHQNELGQTWATHPLSECITCGYILGSNWLKAELPETVISFLESLPETNKIPAWI